jgi:hypothetical protein
MTTARPTISPTETAQDFLSGLRTSELDAPALATASLWATVSAYSTRPPDQFGPLANRIRAAGVIDAACRSCGIAEPTRDELMAHLARAEQAIDAAGISPDTITRAQLHDLGAELMAACATRIAGRAAA